MTDLPRRPGIGDRIALALSTFFGCGLVPFAPGTVGTAGALLLQLILLSSGLGGPVSSAVAALLFTVLAIPLGRWAERHFEQKDPGPFVLDEVAGYFVSLLFLPPTVGCAISAFFLFRFFDVLKPFPIRRIERLPGGWGITLDDLLAGIYSNLSLRLLLYSYPPAGLASTGLSATLAFCVSMLARFL